MKKLRNLLVLSLSLFLLVACSNVTESQSKSSTSSSSQVKSSFTLTIEANNSKKEETLTFTSGQTVMDALKANHNVEEKDGFITAIDGVSQDESKGLYWMFEVNGEMAPKAANQIKLAKGDKVRFYQEVYQN
ncbi:DUF4430 domain-containing protein [Streptococcus saliviloxodontae]|uniref:Uncharacterized protein YcfL n=1 Tax=Streptococcus saliviloxodontae TaxID=1349416 RepID=A0ABS2PMZ5_9STRE|nr:DUF4430 domain-containing protein [Streptococcus saliviloxodontae]MBM7636355.1 uncharacterized protein YcfL [Streptococcus saliviloxodontae]